MLCPENYIKIWAQLVKKYARYDSDNVGSFLLLCKVRFPPNIFGVCRSELSHCSQGTTLGGSTWIYLDDLHKNNEIEMSFKISLWFSAA